MTSFQDLVQSTDPFRGALLLERLISHSHLSRLTKYLMRLLDTALVLIIIQAILVNTAILSKQNALFVRSFAPELYGVFALVAGFWLSTVLLNAFYYSYTSRGMKTLLPEPALRKTYPLSFETALLISSLDGRDMTRGFLRSEIGRLIVSRCGIPADTVTAFIKSARTPIVAGEFQLKDGMTVSFETVLAALYDLDRELAGFLAARGVSKTDLLGCASWVLRLERTLQEEERWWGRDKLGRIPGIGKEWAYGGTYTLARHASEIGKGTLSRTTIAGSPDLESDTNEAEAILARNREANALLIGEEGGLAMEVVYELAKRIESGHVLPPLEHKRIFVFSGVAFASASKTKETLESELIRVLNEAIDAGNIIIAISDFAAFLEAGTKLGSNLMALLEPFLTSPSLQVIALASVDEFHRSLEGSAKCMTLFEKVSIHAADDASLLLRLEDEALRYESRSRLFFTFPAIRAIAESAGQYFSGSSGTDKSADILSEIGPYMAKEGRRVVMRDDVYALVGRKTGIPLGPVTEGEKAKLLDLESLLSKRIVGQKEAVTAVANAMRRARSGVGNPKKPMGSFLFLGPTGVGKTETTKALAEVFFKGEEDIIRFDMSEYKTVDALDRLIGSFKTNEPGVLSSKLREKPYGVLLLDEFEKTNKEVLDLFLQVLDEGFFSDAFGKRVNARNLIIVATSNAGSDVIWEMMKAGALQKDKIVDEIISRGIYKPELLNRFDGVVIFHPLLPEDLRQIATLMLQKLQKRLREKGIELAVTDTLVDMLVKEGSDPKFGARPMNRAIQEKVEQLIATKMLQGEIKAGSRIELQPADFAK